MASRPALLGGQRSSSVLALAPWIRSPRRSASSTSAEATGGRSSVPTISPTARSMKERDFRLFPDIDSERDRCRISRFAMEPGDVLVFQAMIVHGSEPPGARDSVDGRRRPLPSA